VTATEQPWERSRRGRASHAWWIARDRARTASYQHRPRWPLLVRRSTVDMLVSALVDAWMADVKACPHHDLSAVPRPPRLRVIKGGKS
jgi:hypothetical protein